MTTISISQLKTNPAAAIDAAIDYPLAVLSRSQVKAYLVGKDLFEKIYQFLEDRADKKAAGYALAHKQKARDFEAVAKDLGI